MNFGYQSIAKKIIQVSAMNVVCVSDQTEVRQSNSEMDPKELQIENDHGRAVGKDDGSQNEITTLTTHAGES